MKRRKSREYALQFLYRLDFLEGSAETDRTRNKEKTAPKKELFPDLTSELDIFWASAGENDSELRMFADNIIFGTINNLSEIDSIIQKTAKKWKVSRMASIDRNILRFAAYELLFRKDIPSAVTINEALEIAKKYSSSESASFINGILDKIAKECADKTAS